MASRRSDLRTVALAMLGGFLAFALLGVWDWQRPLGSEPPAQIDDRIQENNQALEAALDLEHEFATGGAQTGRHTLGRGTTAARATAYGTPAEGYVWANTETGCWEVYNATDGRWDAFGCGLVGDMKLTSYDPGSPPTGWLPCDGQAVDSTVYVELFTSICPLGLGNCPYDTQDGQGAPGGNLFRLPKFQEHVFAGYDSGAAADYDTMGEYHGDNSTFTVAEANIQEFTETSGTESTLHTHSFTASFPYNGFSGAGYAQSSAFAGTQPTTTQSASHTHQVSVGDPSPTALERRGKFVVVGCLIRVTPGN